ncbi:Uncharacterised protein [Mycobacteroides abscessus subsp. abscessus]|nr:Uncharacterised protein [Mycobacteroides abscessus subsp. abscessus]
MTICEMSAGSIADIDWGSRMSRIICDLRMPSATAASDCPLGSD